MTDATSKYHSLMQQQHTMHPLATMPSTFHSSGNTATPGLVHPDASSPIDLVHTDTLYMGPTSPMEDFEDIDYQPKFTQPMVPRHTSLPGTMDFGMASSNIPIKQDNAGFYTGEYDSFPMSAPAATSHLPHSSPYSNIYIHPQYLPKSLDSPESRSFEEDDYNLQMNMQMMMDKRRRRRESHNAVERRRRENINDRIQELGTLLPETMDSTNKQNKGAILRHSVEHIRFLQHKVQSYSNQVKELESALAKLQSK